MPAGYARVAAEDELWDGDMEVYRAGGAEVLVVRVDGRHLAYAAACPHQRSPLVDGSLDGDVLTCGTHLWEFDARSGRGLNPRGPCLIRHDVRVLDGEVWVGVDPLPAEPTRGGGR